MNYFNLVPVKEYELPKYVPFSTNVKDKAFMKIHADFNLVKDFWQSIFNT